MGGTSLISRKGTGGIAQSRVPMLREGPQDVRPYFPFTSTIPYSELPTGARIGSVERFVNGLHLTLMSTRETVIPGRMTYWKGSEEGKTSSSSAPTIRHASKGEFSVYLGTEGNFEAGAFMGGQLTITGGNSLYTGHSFMIGGSHASIRQSDANGKNGPIIPNNNEAYVTEITLNQPLPFELTYDTDWLIQGNIFDCQSQANSSTDTFTFTGVPYVRAVGTASSPVCYWAVTRGPCAGQLTGSLGSTTNADVTLRPSYANGDVGKFVVTSTEREVAKIINRNNTTSFSADGFVSIWLHNTLRS